MLQGKITTSAKALGWECTRCVQTSARRPMCVSGKEQERTEVGRKDQSQLMQALWATVGTLDVFWVWWKLRWFKLGSGVLYSHGIGHRRACVGVGSNRSWPSAGTRTDWRGRSR